MAESAWFRKLGAMNSTVPRSRRPARPSLAVAVLLAGASACELPDPPEADRSHWGAPPEVEAELRGVIQDLFDAMETRDMELGRRLLLSGGRFLALRETPDGTVFREQSHDQFLEWLADQEPVVLERFWDPEILIRRDLAVVWTPYDFFLNREFSHCGVDAFTLVKTDEGWRIATTVYTVEVTGCDEPPVISPLGPPEWNR